MTTEPSIAIWRRHDPHTNTLTGHNLFAILGRRPWATLADGTWYVLTARWRDLEQLAADRGVTLVRAADDQPTPTPPPIPPLPKLTDQQRAAAHAAYLSAHHAVANRNAQRYRDPGA